MEIPSLRKCRVITNMKPKRNPENVNVCDQIQKCLRLVVNGFVRSVIQIDNDLPAIIMDTDEQITDLISCTTDHDS